MTDHQTAKDDRLERGREILKQIGGPGYDGPTNRLAETSLAHPIQRTENWSVL